MIARGGGRRWGGLASGGGGNEGGRGHRRNRWNPIVQRGQVDGVALRLRVATEETGDTGTTTCGITLYSMVQEALHTEPGG